LGFLRVQTAIACTITVSFASRMALSTKFKAFISGIVTTGAGLRDFFELLPL
jgi:hypothetical protein